MFQIAELLAHAELAPLKAIYDKDQSDPRLVVACLGRDPDVQETIAMHKWMARSGYQRILTSWESADLLTFAVVHIKNLSLEIMRRNPFVLKPDPLPDNSWMNRLDPKRFEALLLAQETGDVPYVPTNMQIKDTIKPALEAENLSPFWKEMVKVVTDVQDGKVPLNSEQKALFDLWTEKAAKRRFYNPTDHETQPQPTQSRRLSPVQVTVYSWGEGDQRRINLRRLYKHIETQLINVEDDAKHAAEWVFGGTSKIDCKGSAENVAFRLYEEAKRAGILDRLASYFEFVIQPLPSVQADGDVIINNVSAGARGVAVGKNISQTIIVTGDINTGGDDYTRRNRW